MAALGFEGRRQDDEGPDFFIYDRSESYTVDAMIEQAARVAGYSVDHGEMPNPDHDGDPDDGPENLEVNDQYARGLKCLTDREVRTALAVAAERRS